MNKNWFKSLAGVTLMLFSCQTNSPETKTPTKTQLPAVSSGVSNLEDKPAGATENLPVTVATNRLIIPGKSIGQTALNMKGDTVNQLLGKGDRQDAAMGKAWVVWYAKPAAPDTLPKETTIYFVTNMGGPDEASRVKQIRVTSVFFKTAAHLGVGSHLRALQKAYPQLSSPQTYTSPQTGKSITILDDKTSGIAFEINAAHICTAVVVHEPQQPVNTTYIHLFP